MPFCGFFVGVEQGFRLGGWAWPSSIGGDAQSVRSVGLPRRFLQFRIRRRKAMTFLIGVMHDVERCISHMGFVTVAGSWPEMYQAAGSTAGFGAGQGMRSMTLG